MIYKDTITQKRKDYLIQKLLTNFKAPIRIIDKQQGNYTVSDNEVFLSWWVGPSTSEEGLFHELAHVVTDRDDQVIQSGHGFSYGKYWEVAGHSGYEAQTTQHIWKELETCWVEYILRKYLDPTHTWKLSAVDALYYLPSTFLWKKDFPEGKNIPYKDWETWFIKSLLKQGLEKYSSVWTEGKVIEEYKRKIQVLSDYFKGIAAS